MKRVQRDLDLKKDQLEECDFFKLIIIEVNNKSINNFNMVEVFVININPD